MGVGGRMRGSFRVGCGLCGGMEGWRVVGLMGGSEPWFGTHRLRLWIAGGVERKCPSGENLEKAGSVGYWWY